MLTSRYAYCGRLYSLIPRPLIESHSWATFTVSFPGHCPIFLACSTNGLVCKNESVNGMMLHFASVGIVSSLVPRPHPARVSLAAILKAIHAGVGFGSGTETSAGMDSEMCGSSKRGWVSFPVFMMFHLKIHLSVARADILAPIAEHMQC